MSPFALHFAGCNHLEDRLLGSVQPLDGQVLQCLSDNRAGHCELRGGLFGAGKLFVVVLPVKSSPMISLAQGSLHGKSLVMAFQVDKSGGLEVGPKSPPGWKNAAKSSTFNEVLTPRSTV